MQPTLVSVVQKEDNAIHCINLYPLYDVTSTEYIIPSTDVMQLTLTPKITTPLVVETSVIVNNNSPIQDYVHPRDHTQPSYEGSSNTYIQTHNSLGIIPYNVVWL